MIVVEQRRGAFLTLRATGKPSLVEAVQALHQWVLSVDPVASHILINLEHARIDGLVTDLREIGLDGFHKPGDNTASPIEKTAWIVPLMSLRAIVDLTLEEFCIARFPRVEFKTFEDSASARAWLVSGLG